MTYLTHLGYLWLFNLIPLSILVCITNITTTTTINTTTFTTNAATTTITTTTTAAANTTFTSINKTNTIASNIQTGFTDTIKRDLIILIFYFLQ